MKKKYKVVLFVIVIIIILVSFLAIYAKMLNKNKKDYKETKIVDEISNFDYSLEERDSKLMKQTFNKLENVLTSETIDYEEYAKLLTQLFIIDLFTISNKNSMYDVGGVEYIIKEDQESFCLNIENSLYENVENYTNRKQKLPIVKSITVNNLKEDKYEYKEKEYDSYLLTMSWEYEKDLGYDENAQVTIIKIDDKLYVAEYIPE